MNSYSTRTNGMGIAATPWVGLLLSTVTLLIKFKQHQSMCTSKFRMSTATLGTCSLKLIAATQAYNWQWQVSRLKGPLLVWATILKQLRCPFSLMICYRGNIVIAQVRSATQITSPTRRLIEARSPLLRRIRALERAEFVFANIDRTSTSNWRNTRKTCSANGELAPEVEILRLLRK